jgi:hypothetical protein
MKHSNNVFSSLTLVSMMSLFIFISGCGPQMGQGSFIQNSNDPTSNGGKINNSGPRFSNCSDLDFSNVTWDPALSSSDHTAIELALNITGSYEGGADWGSIANNRDGQGLSLGLLQQNLGQGSLQALLMSMRDHYRSDMERIFSQAHITSLLSMLSNYQGSQLSISEVNKMSLMQGQMRLSVLDNETAGFSLAGSREQRSVLWALNNLYVDSGATFKSSWKSELQALARDPNYISIQIETSLGMHFSAKHYIPIIGISELRTYLFAFDIVVQNGSFYPGDISDYDQYVRNNPGASESQRLVRILNNRLREVRPRYVHDVQSRKLAIINTTGVVHGTSRNLENEYCYNRFASYQ